MEALQTLIASIAADIRAIKWIALVILLAAVATSVYMSYLFYRLRRMLRPELVANDFRQTAKMLLAMNALDQMIQLANDRIDRFPGDLFAHWYLGQAYYRRKQWHKALAEFNYIYEIAPSWRQRFVNPFIIDIREQLQNTRPEIIKR